MIRHTQQIVGDLTRGDGHNADGVPGDCWKTCVASILDLPLDDVPHFLALEGEDEWWHATQRCIKGFRGEEMELRWWLSIDEVIGGEEYVIATGASPRGNFEHAVVANRSGVIVHDPHPSRAGLQGAPTQFFAIVSVESRSDQ